MTHQPNIVWIYCDELRTDALGCYGHALASLQTPHIDRIASKGMLFRNCFTNSPLCVPARVSVLTGCYPEQTGVYGNEAAWPDFKMANPVETFPERLAHAGYATADFGKKHLPPEMHPFSFRDSTGGGMDEICEPVKRRGLPIIQPAGAPTSIGGRFPADIDFPANKVTDNALSWISKQEGPFCVRLSYLQPHTPVFPPPPYDTIYSGQPFRKHYTESSGPEIERRFAEVTGADNLKPEEIYLTQQYYYGLVRWIDDQVGRLLQALEKMQSLENTLLIFHADHGASLGEGGCFAKHTFAPHVHRVPLILHWPGRIAPSDVDAICQSIDLAPTILNACRLKSPPEMRGRNLLHDPAPSAVFATTGFGLPESRAYPNLKTGTWTDGTGWPRRACIRTQEFRLDLNVRQNGTHPPEEKRDLFLSNWREDPREINNLADHPDLKAVRSDLLSRLEAHLDQALEPKRMN